MATGNNNTNTNSERSDNHSQRDGSPTGPKSSVRRNNNHRNRSKNGKPKKKPSFQGASHDKVTAVIADEPGHDPLSVQLEKLEKEPLIAYVLAEMTATVATTLRTLTPYDFDRSPYFPKPVDPRLYAKMKDRKIMLDEDGNSVVDDA